MENKIFDIIFALVLGVPLLIMGLILFLAEIKSYRELMKEE